MKTVLKSIAVSLALVSSTSFAADSGNATRLKAGIEKAKTVVDRALASVGGGFNGQDVWDLSETLESDALALPILVQASSTLTDAAITAEQALLAFLSGQIALGNVRFAQACNKMGISRSQVARANFAAIRPPLGLISAFGPDLSATANELAALRLAEGCP